MTAPPIVLVHGNFITRRCWDPWLGRIEGRGLRCVAPEWPARDGTPAELRARHPDPATARLTIEEVLAHHDAVIRSFGEPPILIGHSFGGLLVQLLLQRNRCAAAVAVDSVPPQGVLAPSWSFLRSVWPGLNPFVPASRPYLMTLDHFRYAFANTLSPDDQVAAYEREIVPESRRVQRAALSRAGRVDFRREHPPLLFVAGGADHIMPPSVNRANARKYRASSSVTELREFSGRSHLILSEPGWEEVCDFAVDWALSWAGGSRGLRPSGQAVSVIPIASSSVATSPAS